MFSIEAILLIPAVALFGLILLAGLVVLFLAISLTGFNQYEDEDENN